MPDPELGEPIAPVEVILATFAGTATVPAGLALKVPASTPGGSAPGAAVIAGVG
ncbi:MAG: hypothetical protein LBE08_01365 [Bifidobacteriaceae bacterium]|jgi:hypothetical protein|nr:hypothetical protein [Bifidobacteriaceae bacterium]